MSYFNFFNFSVKLYNLSCLVFGENVEEQLEPFYELECTMDQEEMRNDPRAKFVEEFTTEELEKDFIRVKNEHPEHYYETLEDFADDYHEIHKRKIDLANEIFVIDINNYIGSSTQGEIEYAKSNSKDVRYLSLETTEFENWKKEFYNRQILEDWNKPIYPLIYQDPNK